GAMLHVQGGLLDRALLRQRLAMLQSSSPSYPIMASLDLSRSLLGTQGPAFFEGGLAAAAHLRRGLAKLPRFGVVAPPGASGGATAYTIQDPLKLVIFDASAALTGYELHERLEAEGCVPEMSDDRYVVLALGPGTSMEDAERLLQALVRISDEAGQLGNAVGRSPYPVPADELSTWNIAADEDRLSVVSEPVPFGLTPLNPAEIEVISIQDSLGRQAAEMIIPYPPGIPLLYPGETITEAVRQQLLTLRDSGAKCQGLADPRLRTIQVKKR
ncbi:MAG: amino acid decarboxylase, partial [Paenibacillaceae bacterium]|nr:amino acid decarboxylase [Paenibacillaceae bacterium]